MTFSDPDLDQAMARLAQGDRSVFSFVFRSLWQPLFRLCASLLGNEADAKDAAQQALEKVLMRASDYDPRKPALPWALGIASFECRTLRRKRFRRREEPVEQIDRSSLRAPAADPEQREIVRAALEALEGLSETDRETVLATYWEESAAAQGATLRKRRQRALGRLRQALKALYGID